MIVLLSLILTIPLSKDKGYNDSPMHHTTVKSHGTIIIGT